MLLSTMAFTPVGKAVTKMTRIQYHQKTWWSRIGTAAKYTSKRSTDKPGDKLSSVITK